MSINIPIILFIQITLTIIIQTSNHLFRSNHNEPERNRSECEFIVYLKKKTNQTKKVKQAYTESQQFPLIRNIKVKKVRTIANIVMIFQTNFISPVTIEEQLLTNLVLTKHFPFKYCSFPQTFTIATKVVKC